MEDVFDASWQAGSDGRDPDIESALASLIDVRGVALVAQPAQLRLLLTQACPDVPRHVDALLAAVDAGVAERLRAADDDAALPALLRQCAHALQQKSSLDARWSAWSVRTWAHAFALPTDVRAMPAAPSTNVPPSVPFGRAHDADREPGLPTARAAGPARSPSTDESRIDGPASVETIGDEPASVPVLGDEMLLDSTRDEAVRPAPVTVEMAEPASMRVEETLPAPAAVEEALTAPTPAEEAVPPSTLDDDRLPPAYDQQPLPLPTPDVAPRTATSQPTSVSPVEAEPTPGPSVGAEPTEPPRWSMPPTAAPARRRVARPVVAAVAILDRRARRMAGARRDGPARAGDDHDVAADPSVAAASGRTGPGGRADADTGCPGRTAAHRRDATGRRGSDTGARATDSGPGTSARAPDAGIAVDRPGRPVVATGARRVARIASRESLIACSRIARRAVDACTFVVVDLDTRARRAHVFEGRRDAQRGRKGAREGAHGRAIAKGSGHRARRGPDAGRRRMQRGFVRRRRHVGARARIGECDPRRDLYRPRPCRRPSDPGVHDGRPSSGGRTRADRRRSTRTVGRLIRPPSTTDRCAATPQRGFHVDRRSAR